MTNRVHALLSKLLSINLTFLPSYMNNGKSNVAFISRDRSLVVGIIELILNYLKTVNRIN